MARFITQIGQSKMILAFIIILGLIMGYFGYYGGEPIIIPEEPSSGQRRESIESLANFKIDFSVLDNEVYKSLEVFGENPVDPGITGERRNPFQEL